MLGLWFLLWHGRILCEQRNKDLDSVKLAAQSQPGPLLPGPKELGQWLSVPSAGPSTGYPRRSPNCVVLQHSQGSEVYYAKISVL